MDTVKQETQMLAIHFSENFIHCPSYRKVQNIFVSLLAVHLQN